jgi:hypothetical protein
MAEIKDNRIIILGNEYIEMPKRESKSYMSSRIKGLVMLASAMMSLDSSYKKPKERPLVNLIEEYELILQKKSKLSRNNRDWVVKEFNKNFVKVK